MEDDHEQLQDEFLKLIDNTEACLDMVRDATGNQMLYPYLKRLVPRLRKMYQPFSWVEYRKEIGGTKTFEYFIIHNYSFNTYRWAINRNLEAYMTDTNISIPLEELNEQEIKQLMEKANE